MTVEEKRKGDEEENGEDYLETNPPNGGKDLTEIHLL